MSFNLKHRCVLPPDTALKGQSIMMLLDHENFWNTVLKHELDNKVL